MARNRKEIFAYPTHKRIFWSIYTGVRDSYEKDGAMLAASGDLGAMDGPVRACAGSGWFCAVRQRGIRCFAAERHSSARLAGRERVGVRGERIGMDGVSGARWVRCGGIV